MIEALHTGMMANVSVGGEVSEPFSVTNGVHEATSAFDHEDNLDGQSDKQGNTCTDRAAIYGRSPDQK